MSKLDKIYSTWMSLEELYQKKCAGKSRLDFLKGLVTPIAITQTRNLVMSDFVESEENIKKMNWLFNIMELATNKIEEGCIEPLNLDDFLTDLIQADEGIAEISEDEFNLHMNSNEKSANEMMKMGLCRNCYTTHNSDVKIEMFQENEDGFLSFDTQTDVLLWLHQNQNDVKKNKFVGGVYAFLLKSIAEKRAILPITFSEQKLLEGCSYEKEDCFNDVSGTYQTVGKTTFKSTVKWQSVCLHGIFGAERVYVCE